MKEQMIDKAQIRKIHTLKGVLGMPDSLYRRMLEEAFSAVSSKQLTFIQARRFIMVLEDFQRTFHKGDEIYYEAHFSNFGLRFGMATPEQLRKIEYLWNKFCPSYSIKQNQTSLRTFLSRKFKVSDVRFMDVLTAGKVITALTAMTERKKRTSKNAPQTHFIGEAI